MQVTQEALNQVMLMRNGKPGVLATICDGPLTLRWAMIYVIEKSPQGLTPETSRDRAKLADRIEDKEKPVYLASEDVTLIKKLGADSLVPFIYRQVQTAIEPPDDEATADQSAATE